MANKIRAAAYARMSSDKQETSPDQQRDEIAKYADAHGYSIVDWYEDLGISGDATNKRIGFQRMVADGATGKFRAILCWDQDRFGRFDLIEAGKWIHPLREAGCFDTVTGGKTDWTSLVDQLSYMAKQMGKHQYLQDLAKNVRRGQNKTFESGVWTQGFAPFGYAKDPETKKLVLGPVKEVRIVKEIFRRYVDGISPARIVEWVNRQGIKTRRGNDWQRRTLDHMLKNPHYRGHTYRKPQSRSKYLEGRDDWEVIHNTHEAIIDQPTWERSQERREMNKHLTAPNSKNQYPLTGILYCGNCGNRMGGGKDGGKARYICLGYAASKGCERRTVNQDLLLREVLKQIRVQFFDRVLCPENREQIKAAIRDAVVGGKDELSRQRQRDKERLAQLDSELENAVTAMIATSDDLRPLVEKRVRSLQDERDAAADRLAQQVEPAGEQIKRLTERIDAAVGWLDCLEEMIDTDYDPEELGRMLRTFIDRIEVDTERVPEGKSGKRHKVNLVAGRIYFQAGPLTTCVNMLNPPRRTSC